MKFKSSIPAFELTFQRSSPMFKAIVVTPAIVIIFMTLVSFWLPPQSGEKLLLNGTACIMICILLLYFSQQLTIHASKAPFIGKRRQAQSYFLLTIHSKLFGKPQQATKKNITKSRAQLCRINKIFLLFFLSRFYSFIVLVTFYSHTLYLLCFSFVISVIVINISRNRKHYAVPRSIKRNILEGCIGKMFGGGEPRRAAGGNEDDEEDQQETQLNQASNSDEQKITQSSLSLNSFDNHQLQWIRLAKVIDRAAFVIYLFVYVFIGALHFV